MLIKVFGIWLVIANVHYLHQADILGDVTCSIEYGTSSVPIDKTCDQVAEEINKQIKEQSDNK